MIDLFTIEIEPALETTSISDILTNVNTIINSCVNIIVFIGGILGLKYINKLRERQSDSVFSYLTRLNVRLRFFKMSLTDYKTEILDQFIPESHRREIGPERVVFIDEVINNFSESAKETLNFLRNENDQMPAQIGWFKCLDTLIEFLNDCEHLIQNGYYKWNINNDMDSEKESYYCKHMENINKLIEMITDRQRQLEIEIFKKSGG